MSWQFFMMHLFQFLLCSSQLKFSSRITHRGIWEDAIFFIMLLYLFYVVQVLRNDFTSSFKYGITCFVTVYCQFTDIAPCKYIWYEGFDWINWELISYSLLDLNRLPNLRFRPRYSLVRGLVQLLHWQCPCQRCHDIQTMCYQQFVVIYCVCHMT